MIKIRQARESDIELIYGFDHLAQNKCRKVFIEKSVKSNKTMVAVLNGQVTGYIVLDYSFYSNGFISMLYVHSEYRKNGIGNALLEYAESVCKTNKLFTSTNESNFPMQSLLKKKSYLPSGRIDNLNENDPELVYFKKLRSNR